MAFYDLENCTECGKSWKGKPIPEESRHLFGGSSHFSLVIALSSFSEDHCYAYQCPFCGTTWDRDTRQVISHPKLVDMEGWSDPWEGEYDRDK